MRPVLSRSSASPAGRPHEPIAGSTSHGAKKMPSPFDPDDVIHTYSRAQALADGTLRDVTPMAREAGIRFPVALTAAAWTRCVALTPAAQRAGNDEDGRLWDVLWTLALAARRSNASDLSYELLVITDSPTPTRVTLRAVIGPGDDPNPVLTVMLPEED